VKATSGGYAVTLDSAYLDQLEADARRLDWIEDHRAEVLAPPAVTQYSDYRGEPNEWGVREAGTFGVAGIGLRAAIDAAMTAAAERGR
jgi:hypothetical protein